MQLQLKRPICFFDLETTGVNIAKDRIVEISILKAFPDGSEQENTWLGQSGHAHSSRGDSRTRHHK